MPVSARALVLLCAGALSACGSSSRSSPPAQPHFSGVVGAAWEPVAALSNDPGAPGFSDYTPPGRHVIYDIDELYAARLDPTGWTTLAAPPAVLEGWPSPAWVGDALYVLRNDAVYRYGITADAWTTPITTGVGETVDAQMTHDDAGRVYALETAAPFRVIRYDPAANSLTRLPTGGLGLDVNEPRIAWDPGTRRLYIGPRYNRPQLWEFDPDAPGTAVRLPDVPSAAGGPGTGVGDPFCGDRSGHLYAIGDTGCDGSATVFQYDIAARSWRRIPDLPEDHGCNGACTVSSDGWLYLVGGGNGSMVYRIRLE